MYNNMYTVKQITLANQTLYPIIDTIFHFYRM